MTIAEIVVELNKRGFRVETHARTRKTASGDIKTDGLRITRINDKTFSKSSSAGVKEARRILGIKLSSKKASQLAKNRKAISRQKLTKKQREQVKKFNKTQKKLGKNKYGVVAVRRRKKRTGWKGVRSAMSNIERHNRGYAYIRNVEILAERLRNVIRKDLKKFQFTKQANIVMKHKLHFPDSILTEIYYILYKFEDLQLSETSAINAIDNLLSRL